MTDLSALESAARAGGLEVIHLGREVQSAPIIRRQIEQGRSLFVAAGGDGTINAVMQPLIHSEAALGVIPIGSYNHFARDAGLPLDWREALDVALNGSLRQVDAARINDRYFVNNVSIGLYPEMVAHRERLGRETSRWRARLYASVTTLRKYPHVTLNVESDYLREVIRTHVFMVSNNSYDLSRIGIQAARSTLQEGRLSVYWLPHIPRIALMRFLAHYLAGRVSRAPGFRSFRTTAVKVQSPQKQLRVGIDGEVEVMQPPLVITILPCALNVMAPGEG